MAVWNSLQNRVASLQLAEWRFESSRALWRLLISKAGVRSGA